MRERAPIFNIPGAVSAALLVLVGVHLYRSLLSSEDDLAFLLAFAFIPARYSGGIPDLPGGTLSEFTSFVTYMFIHGDLTHLIVNSVWMLAFGSAVARRVGSLRFLVFSLVCGIAGALVHLAVHFGEPVPVVGASAAISGQMAAAIRFVFGARGGFSLTPENLRSIPLASIGDTLKDPRILMFLAIWAGINLLFGLGYLQLEGMGGGIAWEAHIGGFLSGLLIFGLFDRGPGAKNGG